MMRVNLPLLLWANGEDSTPHSCGSIDVVQERVDGMFLETFVLMAPEKRAGEEGWSVTVTEEAPARAETMEGRAVPISSKTISKESCKRSERKN